MNFLGKGAPTYDSAWKLYEKGLSYNNQIGLDDTVKDNENFFASKQWENVEANGLPTPQMNFIKRVVCFVVSTITTDNLAIQATILPSTPGKKKLARQVNIVNNEFQALLEMNRVAKLMRSFARDAAVRGDACLYTYFDAEAETGQEAKGAIKTEIIKNNRVFFGNPNDQNVQSQPYIMIEQQVMERDAQQEAKRNGNGEWEAIKADDEGHGVESAKKTDDKVTVVTLLWKDEDTREIWAYRFSQNGFIRKPWNLEIKRYPVVWMSWENIDDCYHGQSMIAGIIPNQVFVNKSWAMAMLSIMKMAFPKWVYDKTRIKAIDNRVGSAIPINGGDVNGAIKAIDPPAISPQVYQFMESAVKQTQENLGASDVALGDTRPDNAAAIISLQRAAATPSELTKMALYDCAEDLFRIYLEFIVNYYGTRYIDVETSEEERQAMQFANLPIEDEVTISFDFATLRNAPFVLRMEAGASSYYSEIACVSTLTNLLTIGAIDIVDFLKHIPDSCIMDRRGLLADVMSKTAVQVQKAPVGSEVVDQNQPEPVPTGGGYASMQRKINEGVA